MTAPQMWHHLSSRGLSNKGREELFWNTFNSHILNFEWTPYRDQLSLDAHIAELPGLRIATGRGMAVAQRTREAIKDGNDDLVLLINLDSDVSISRRGDYVGLPAGGAFFGTCAEPFAQAGDLGIGIRLPRSSIAHLVQDIDNRTASFVRPDNAALKLLIDYVRALRANSLSPNEAVRLAAPQLHDLIALVVGTDVERTRHLSRRSLGKIQLLALQRDIEQLIRMGRISADLLARRHRLTPRYVRMLFEREGISLGRYVIERRLHRAAEMLANPQLSHRKISDVAYDTGFGDLSYFNRAFRRLFDCSPSDLRAAGKGWRVGGPISMFP